MLSLAKEAPMTPPTAAVGFVGLGTMGSALSAHLIAAGWRVTGYDIDAARLAAHTGRGGAAAASPAGTAVGDVVVLSLPTAQALLYVAAGAAGLASVNRPGLVVIDTSTLPLATKRQARDALAERGIVLLDCPLSGTGGQALTKDVVAYLSGPAQAKALALPVLGAMTRAVHDVGEFGGGSAVKFVANLLVAIHNVAAAEALVLAERAGLDLAVVLAAVADGAGSSDMFEVRGPAMAAADYSGPGVTTTVFAKDLEIIAGFAKDTSTPTPLFALASSFYAAALAQGHAGDDTACVHAVLRGLAGG
jgi:3-hydroxyisobutyrate dehydrogenase-like beta-hydroxyacid dehydrogenase